MMEADKSLLSPTEQEEIIRNLAERLQTCYVFPEQAGEICAALQKHLEDGDYSDLGEGEYFALALTLHMREVVRDEHIWVKWHAEALPEGDDPLRLNPEWQEARRLEAMQENFGFSRLEVLPRNVGFLEIRYFHRAEWGTDAVSAAMNSLANCSSLVIDLRECTGGYPDMIALVLSFLFGEEPVHLSSIHWRDDDTTQDFWTLREVPGKRLSTQPVYVLTSKTTFSGGEGFAYVLQTRQRGKVVGERTDGGAHPGASYRLHPHFEAFLPIGRIIDAVTGRDWEGTGVVPDVPVPTREALEVALRMAMGSGSDSSSVAEL